MSRIVCVALLLTFAACPKQDARTPDRVPPPAPPRDAAASVPAPTPAARAQQILDAQVAALSAGSDAPLVATFDKDAIVLVPDPRPAADPLTGLRAAIARTPPSSGVTSVKADPLAAGGNADAVWFTTSLHVTYGDGNATVRVTELATAQAGWKVVAAAFSEDGEPRTSKLAPVPMRGATKNGPLAAFLAAPAQLAAALAPDAQVVALAGTATTGDAAKQAITSLSDLRLHGDAREVAGPSWGFAIGALSVPKGKHLGLLDALVIAVPAPTGSWSVVAVHLASP